MYIPSAFRVDDPAVLNAFIRRHSFATLITAGDGPFITHLPLRLEADENRGTLLGHFARTNPHWQLDHARQSGVAVFHGPHAYISRSAAADQLGAIEGLEESGDADSAALAAFAREHLRIPEASE